MRFRFGGRHCFQNSKRLSYSFIENEIIYMHLSLIFKSPIILSILKIVTLNFTMHIFSLLLLENFLKLWKVFYLGYVSISKRCRRLLSYHQVLLCKYLHLQYSVFIIYDELKTVPQTPSHDKVSQKHATNWLEKFSRGSVIPTKLLLCIFIEISFGMGAPTLCRFVGCDPERS